MRRPDLSVYHQTPRRKLYEDQKFRADEYIKVFSPLNSRCQVLTCVLLACRQIVSLQSNHSMLKLYRSTVQVNIFLTHRHQQKHPQINTQKHARKENLSNTNKDACEQSGRWDTSLDPQKKQQLELLFDPHRHQSDFEGKLELTHRSILPVTLGTGVLLDVYMAFNHVCQSFLLFYFFTFMPKFKNQISNSCSQNFNFFIAPAASCAIQGMIMLVGLSVCPSHTSSFCL